jgi:hypothetical protein
MNQKKAIFLSSGILAFGGIMVSVIIIAIGGGFSGPGPSILNPPSKSDLWAVGNNLVNNTELNYSLATGPTQSTENVSMKFIDSKKDWKVNISIGNDTNASSYNITLSKKSFTPVGILNPETEKGLKPISMSILSIRDIAREPKYLVVGAVWDTMNVGPSAIPLRITDMERVDLEESSYDSFVLSYEIANVQSKIYISKELPFPLKAEVYNENGTVKYRYELESIRI